MKKVILSMSVLIIICMSQLVFAEETTYQPTTLVLEIAKEDKMQVDEVTKKENTTLFYSGDEVKLENDILIVDGRSYLPLREYAELFHAEIDWNEKDRVAIVKKDNKIIEIPINHNKAVVTEQGKSTVKDLDASNPKVVAFIYQEHAYLPMQFLGRQMNYGTYYWKDKKGNSEIYLRDEENVEDIFTYIYQPLDIDCANNDVSALTEYLAQNVKGFDKENCEISLIHDNVYNASECSVYYDLKYKGYYTPYYLMASVEGKMVEYVTNLHEFDLKVAEKVTLVHADDIPNDVIAKAKAKAVDKDLPEGYGVKEQKVTKRLDKEFNPYLAIGTVYYDEIGAMYAKEYQYYLN